MRRPWMMWGGFGVDEWQLVESAQAAGETFEIAGELRNLLQVLTEGRTFFYIPE